MPGHHASLVDHGLHHGPPHTGADDGDVSTTTGYDVSTDGPGEDGGKGERGKKQQRHPVVHSFSDVLVVSMKMWALFGHRLFASSHWFSDDFRCSFSEQSMALFGRRLFAT